MAELADALLNNRECQPLDVVSMTTHPGSSPGSFTKFILCLTNDAGEKDVVGFKPLYLFDF